MFKVKLIAKTCILSRVWSAEREQYVRDAFLADLTTAAIRQILLENTSLSLNDAHRQARSLERTQTNNELNQQPFTFVNAASAPKQDSLNEDTCHVCGSKRHPRLVCPDFYATCSKRGLCESMEKQISATERIYSL